MKMCLVVAIAVSCGTCMAKSDSLIDSYLGKNQDVAGTSQCLVVAFTVKSQNNQFEDRGQPGRLGTGKAVFGNGCMAYQINYAYDSLPKYRKKGYSGYEKVDYDREDNLVYWRQSARSGYFDRNFDSCADLMECCRISPSGKLVGKTSSKHSANCKSPGDDMAVNYLEMALGIDQNKFLKRGSFQAAKPDGGNSYTQTFAGEGSAGTGTHGIWKVQLGRNGNHVRTAQFTPTGLNLPALSIYTTGTVSAGNRTFPKDAEVVQQPGQMPTFYKLTAVSTASDLASALKPFRDEVEK